MGNDWFQDKYWEDADDDYFQIDKANSRHVAMITEWFFDKLEHIIDMRDFHELYFDNEKKILRLTNRTQYDMYSNSEYETFEIPYGVFFSDSSIGNWMKEDRENKKQLAEEARQQQKINNETKYKAERRREYEELRKEFG